MHIHNNNAIVRLNRETHPRTRVVEAVPDGNSALMLVYAEFRHVASTPFCNKKYMKHLKAAPDDASITG